MVVDQYYPLTDKQAALAQSADWWTKVLGRAKRPQDVTQFLFSVIVNPNTGQAFLVVDGSGYAELFPKLTPQQQAFVTSHLVQANDPSVVACLEAMHALVPTAPSLNS